ncbi:type I 3-dehydroquinate dehydratase [Azotobacter beijerinckii]|uniref:3-dehydroquinate dehydratase n=1 Tax=Azotobacter beijerinckii TaxID=170623 RepID=A0A1I4HHZ2_9GAMM|nr:type I 3-dehydroquinate dehydratase [Azotobacter beijerinckii]SFB61956.1 3-dehydroquinate dehydratase [Azotobacter beijerinckii]SFL41812.1 3-dehydroquinate dehydratase [Azotobacter beijerinckii]
MKRHLIFSTLALLAGQSLLADAVSAATDTPSAKTETASAIKSVHSITIRNVVIGEGAPKIAVPTTGSTVAQVLDQARQVGSNKDADIIEYRIDYLDFAYDAAEVARLGKQVAEAVHGKPVILTFRTGAEGGPKPIKDEDYGNLYSALIEAGFADLLDVEMFRDEKVVKRLVDEAHKAGVKVIMSSHDFHKTPPTEEMVSRLRRQQELGADVLKIAVMPHDPGDVLKLEDATWQMRSRYTDRPLMTMSMASPGVISRLSGEVFGQSITVGKIGQASAPGQVDVKELRAVLDTIHESVQGN